MDDERFAASLLRLQIICGGIAASVLVYVGIAWVLIRQGTAANMATLLPPAVPWALAAAAVLLIVGGNQLPKAMLGRAAQPGNVGSPGGTQQSIQTAYIIGFALHEAAAILGLILSLVSGRLMWVLVFGGAALLAMAGAWPTREKIRPLLADQVEPTDR